MTIKFATFNVENLFTRPKAMNLSKEDLGTEKLATIARLQAELAKKIYNKALIAKLALGARGYFKINKTRGSNPLSYSRETKKYSVKVKGRDSWDGYIELVRDNFKFESVANTGKLLRALKADIVGVCEVEDRAALRRFRTDHLSREKWTYDLLIDGNDPRGIDIAVYSRFPLGFIRTNSHYKKKSSDRFPLFSRDCLEVEIKLQSGKSLWILQNHLKSKLGPSQKSDSRRKAQAKKVREILEDRYDLAKDLVIVSGDLNDTPESGPLKPLMSLNGLNDVHDVMGTPHDKRWTHAYRKNKNQIDFTLVSDKLAESVVAAGVDRRGIAEVAELTNGAEQPLAGITSWRNAASDHGAVWAALDI